MLSIVAPAYNEEAVIEAFVRQVVIEIQDAFSEWELLIINDGSTDHTAAILSKLQCEYPNLVIIEHNVNLGLGKALETGFADARGDVIVTMDADCSHDPALISELYKEILAGNDVVIASRYIRGGGMPGVPLWRQYLSISGNHIMGAIFKWPARDSTSGYRAYRREVVHVLEDLPPGFEVQAFILMCLKGYRIKEIPLQLHNRIAGYSKMRYRELAKGYIRVLLTS